jgi:putative nucleotide binding protein
MGIGMEKKDLKKDDWAVVLDFLVRGHYGMDRPQPVAYVLGERYFSLLEVIVRDDIELKQGERVYIGDKKREKIKYIKERIKVDDLSAAAREELEKTVSDIVENHPESFLEFFNTAGQLTTRMHRLELLPGVGKKHLWAILEERKSKPFKSFEDLKKRVPLLPDPEKMIVRRVLTELEDKDKYRIFVPKFEKQERRGFKAEFRR